MPTLWLFDIEAHDQRYTCEWKEFLPKQLRRAMYRCGGKSWRLKTISGGRTTGETSDGAFINFAETNVYKTRQVQKFTRHLSNGDVEDGDRLLFADAWHPGVMHCRYMADLYQVNFEIDVMWHAGSYDPHDLLGQRKFTRRWAKHFERAVMRAAARNYFATEFHLEMCHQMLEIESTKTSFVVGWPMEYLSRELLLHKRETKTNVILFPHRISKEKQPQFTVRLQQHLPDYQIVVAQEKTLSKTEYRELIGGCVAVISFSKQETLGIGVYEGMLCGAVPIVPNRLSYAELYPNHCYRSE